MSAPLPNVCELIEAYGARTLPVWVEGDGNTLTGTPGIIERKPLGELAPELFTLLGDLAFIIESYASAEVDTENLPEDRAQRQFALMREEQTVRDKRVTARLLASFVQRRLR